MSGCATPPPAMIGQDPRILELLEIVEQVAATDAPVLITGESGTGKDLLARRLHARSRRRQRPYRAVNCGAIPASLAESELFGHVPGAFTGAVGRKRGVFEAADGGTLFLDEIGETAPALQVLLLRVLQSGEYAPVGSSESRRCDVRVVAATNRDLDAGLEAGAIRRDLYYRLSVIRVDMPPLRERPGDILPLAHCFAGRFAAAYGWDEPGCAPGFEEALLAHHWPGNVRELENAVHRAVILARGGPLAPRFLPPEMSRPSPLDGRADRPPADFHQAKQVVIERFERDYLATMLRACGGIICRAADRSGLSERNFHEKLQRYGINGRSFRTPPTAAALAGDNDGAQ
jgi:DNA-binding NtrC family response regulator